MRLGVVPEERFLVLPDPSGDKSTTIYLKATKKRAEKVDSCPSDVNGPGDS